MGLFEQAIPKRHRTKFVNAVAARRTVNAAKAKGKGVTVAQSNRDYQAMNALPLWLQAIADRRAK
jgi:hypothetical protein